MLSYLRIRIIYSLSSTSNIWKAYSFKFLNDANGLRLKRVFTPKVGKRRGHTYCNYAQMGASVCLCVSDAQEKNRGARFYGLDQVGRHCYLNVVEFEAVAVAVLVDVAADTVHVVVFVGVVDIVASAVVADVAVTEVVDVAVVVGAVVVAVAVVGAGIDAGAAAVGSVVAFFAPSQRPSKRTHRGPSNRFDLPVILYIKFLLGIIHCIIQYFIGHVCFIFIYFGRFDNG